VGNLQGQLDGRRRRGRQRDGEDAAAAAALHGHRLQQLQCAAARHAHLHETVWDGIGNFPEQASMQGRGRTDRSSFTSRMVAQRLHCT